MKNQEQIVQFAKPGVGLAGKCSGGAFKPEPPAAGQRNPVWYRTTWQQYRGYISASHRCNSDPVRADLLAALWSKGVAKACTEILARNTMSELTDANCMATVGELSASKRTRSMNLCRTCWEVPKRHFAGSKRRTSKRYAKGRMEL